MNYFVADSYKNLKWSEEKRFEKNGKLYVVAEEKCDRCGGSGVFACRVENGHIVPHPAYNGVCLKCNGSGKVHKTIRLYTAAEQAKLDNAARRRQEAKEIAQKEREARLNAESEQNRREWLKKNNFSDDGIAYCVVGEDTYSIKDALKEMGCRYNPVLGWYAASEIQLPADFKLVPISFDNIYTWLPQAKRADYKEDASTTVSKILKEAKGADTHEYYDGIVGDRIRNITAKVKSIKGFNGSFGWTNIFTFESGNALLVWFTASDKDLHVGDVVDLSGTIKAFQEYKDQKTTVITRCTIKAII